jgi:hypothetical protein
VASLKIVDAAARLHRSEEGLTWYHQQVLLPTLALARKQKRKQPLRFFVDIKCTSSNAHD